MTKLIECAVDTYLGTYRDLIATERTDDSVTLSFPFHLAAGHRVEITVTDIGGERCWLSDSARTMGEIEAAGYSLAPSVKDRLERLAGLSGVRIVDNHLVLECAYSDLGESIQRFLEMCKTIGDVYLAHRYREKPDAGLISSVRKILDSKGLLYRLDEKVAGKIELHPFNVVVPSNGKPGLAVSVLSGKNTHNVAQIWYFKCDDVKNGEWYQRTKSRLALVYDVRGHVWSEASREILASRADLALPSDSLEDLREFI
jgi:hypothetical protein